MSSLRNEPKIIFGAKILAIPESREDSLSMFFFADEIFQLGKLGYEIYEFCTREKERRKSSSRKNTYCRPLGIGR